MSQTEVQLIKDAVIVNADVSNSAAIDVSKISGAMPLTGGTFTNDVTFDGATAGRDIVFDRSDNSLEFLDNSKLILGSGADCQLLHDGTDTFIQNKVGDLKIANNVAGDVGGDITIQAMNGEDSIKCIHDGAVELYNDNARKLKTNSTGLQVGTTSARFLLDNITSGDGSQDIGRVGLNRDNNSTSDRQIWNQYTVAPTVAKFNVFSRTANDTGTAGNYLEIDAANNNFDIPRDNLKLRIGASADLQLYHDGSDSYIDEGGTGSLLLRTTNNSTVAIKNSNDNMARFLAAGAVELYHAGTKKAETVSGGFTVTGVCTATSFSGSGANLTDVDAGATGGGSDKIFYENGQTVTTNYTIGDTFGAACNAMAAGPITINSGVTVQVNSGETLTIV